MERGVTGGVLKIYTSFLISLGGALLGVPVLGCGMGYFGMILADKALDDATGFGVLLCALIAACIGAGLGAKAGASSALALHRSSKAPWIGYVVAVSGYLLVVVTGWWIARWFLIS